VGGTGVERMHVSIPTMVEPDAKRFTLRSAGRHVAYAAPRLPIMRGAVSCAKRYHVCAVSATPPRVALFSARACRARRAYAYTRTGVARSVRAIQLELERLNRQVGYRGDVLAIRCCRRASCAACLRAIAFHACAQSLYAARRHACAITLLYFRYRLQQPEPNMLVGAKSRVRSRRLPPGSRPGVQMVRYNENVVQSPPGR